MVIRDIVVCINVAFQVIGLTVEVTGHHLGNCIDIQKYPQLELQTEEEHHLLRDLTIEDLKVLRIGAVQNGNILGVTNITLLDHLGSKVIKVSCTYGLVFLCKI